MEDVSNWTPWLNKEKLLTLPKYFVRGLYKVQARFPPPSPLKDLP